VRLLAKAIIVGAWALVAVAFLATIVVSIVAGIWYALLAYLGIPLAFAISWAFHYRDDHA
jgi:hypothetical protein